MRPRMETLIRQFRLSLMLVWSLLALLTVNSFLSRSLMVQAAVGQQANDLSITSVNPSYGWNDLETWVYVYGTGFIKPLTVTLGSTVLSVQEVTPERILAVVPAGLTPSLYNLTVESAKGNDTLPAAYNVLEATDVDDLTSLPEWLWTYPSQLRVGGVEGGGVGVKVQRLGGRNTIVGSAVEFQLESPQGFVVLGQSNIPFLAPNTAQSSASLIWQPDQAGQYTICAIIDPDNEFEETNESNNQICRTVTVLENEPDVIAPIVDEFEIEDGAQSTDQLTVTLDVTAIDSLPEPVSGVDAIYFIEFEYDWVTRNWMPVLRSDWVNYSIAHQNYTWTLTDTFGIHYIRTWAVDKAGNISLDSGIDAINLLPSEEAAFVEQDEVDFYRVFVNAGETLTTTLTPQDGDADLYIWDSTGQLWYSNQTIGEDLVTFEAPDTGTYQIEVHGYSDAEYRLAFRTTYIPLEPSCCLQTGDKPLPSAPAVSLSSSSGSDFHDINPPSNFYIYLPLIR